MMDRAPLSTQRALCLAALGFLLLLAWQFYLERMTTQDSAFFSWLMLDTHMPFAAHGRIGSWLPQVVPLFLIWLQAPLEAVLRSYSVSIALVHVLIFWILAYRLRDERAALALPIALVAGTHIMFYLAISEVYLGLSFLLLVWAFMGRCLNATTAKSAWIWGGSAVVMNIWVGLHHPILVLPLLFILGYEALGYTGPHKRRFLVLAVLLLVWYGLRGVFVPATGYEEGRMPSIADILHYSTRLDELGSTKHLHEVWPKFMSLGILMVACSLILIVQRKWLRLIWSVGFSLGFLVLILVTDRDGHAQSVYENYYPILALVWGVVLGDRWGTISWSLAKRARWAVLVAVLVIGCVQVWRGHYLFTAKIEYMDRLTSYLRTQGVHKGSISRQSLPWSHMQGEWPFAFESALVSARTYPGDAVTLFCGAEDLKLDTMYHKGNAFLGPNWCPIWFTTNNLNQAYFRFTDEGYTVVNQQMPDSVLRLFEPGSITLEPLDDEVTMLPDRFTVVPVRITNRSDRSFGSLSEDGSALRLHYQLFDEQGKLVQDEHQTSELETDIVAHSSYVNGLVIERPNASGRYRVEVDLRTDAHGSTGIRASFWIERKRFF